MSYPIDLTTLKRKIPLRSSPVAQLVEQVTVNHRVAGSIPARGAIFSHAFFPTRRYGPGALAPLALIARSPRTCFPLGVVALRSALSLALLGHRRTRGLAPGPLIYRGRHSLFLEAHTIGPSHAPRRLGGGEASHPRCLRRYRATVTRSFDI